MYQQFSVSRLANLCARTILRGFGRYRTQFAHLTRRARTSFAQRDWQQMQEDARARLTLYEEVEDAVVKEVHDLLASQVRERLMWVSIKAVYSGLIDGRGDWNIAETFFNSITRQVFATVGVDPHVEFVTSDYEVPLAERAVIYRTFSRAESTEALLHQLLDEVDLDAGWADRARDVTLTAQRINARLQAVGALAIVERLEVIHEPFFRGKGAYIVGRLYSGSHLLPFALALHHEAPGVRIDAVLLEEDPVSILFSFARSYFHIDVDRPYDLIRFLKTILPRKRVAELYISTGYNKHGKTELYRDLISHLALTEERFARARGQRGMVMTVFTMPNYDLVFKVIKDQFDYPKESTRQEVLDKYKLVFRRERAGRLVDAQAFEHLQFAKERFGTELLAELEEDASNTVWEEGDRVVVDHAYIERRVIPLDIYVREAGDASARQAVIDYGQALKDLAASNIFPGDLFLKNFGVTRHGRVVFYDYDELSLLTTCVFKELPEPQTYEQAMAPEPWFHVGEHDIFPEEFKRFLGLPDPLMDVFEAHHADLFTAAYWQAIQQQVREGEVLHTVPYAVRFRLDNQPSSA